MESLKNWMLAILFFAIGCGFFYFGFIELFDTWDVEYWVSKKSPASEWSEPFQFSTGKKIGRTIFYMFYFLLGLGCFKLASLGFKNINNPNNE